MTTGSDGSGRSSPPRGVLGVRWGEKAAAAAARLGVRCQAWTPWEGGAGFELCHGAEAALVFGAPGRLRLIRRNGRLEGVQVEYPACGPQLRQALAEALEIDPDTPQPYRSWRRGEVVRLAVYPDGACTLTTAGPEFGKAYAAWVLGEGLRGLAAGLRP